MKRMFYWDHHSVERIRDLKCVCFPSRYINPVPVGLPVHPYCTFSESFRTQVTIRLQRQKKENVDPSAKDPTGCWQQHSTPRTHRRWGDSRRRYHHLRMDPDTAIGYWLLGFQVERTSFQASFHRRFLIWIGSTPYQCERGSKRVIPQVSPSLRRLSLSLWASAMAVPSWILLLGKRSLRNNWNRKVVNDSMLLIGRSVMTTWLRYDNNWSKERFIHSMIWSRGAS